MPISTPIQPARAVKIQHEREQRFQKNKEAIKADLDDLTLRVQDLAEKWKVSERMMRRWSERVGVDPVVRRAERAKVVSNKSKGGVKPHNDLPPQAHKLIGLW